MDQNISSRNEKLAQRIIKGLESRNMEGYYVKTKKEALEKALELIPEGASVGMGGSMSVQEIGLKDAVKNGNYHFIDRNLAGTPEERRKAELACMDTDYFLASSNAITEDGILVNIDGHCNRCAAILFGPRNVLMIVGMNKVVRDLDAAVSRARNTAATINAQRFDISTPCKKTGSCADCKSKDTICCQFVITRFSKDPGRIKVILTEEPLGF